MHKTGLRRVFTTFVVGVMVCAPFAQVRAETSMASLQAQINSLLQVIAQLQAQLGTVSGGSNGSGASCVALTRTLYVGLSDAETGGEVTKLQRFLGMNPTGFFGPMTEGKVREWQARKGIVTSGDADTTGYGLVGARTRALMNQCGGSSMPTTSRTPTIEFSASDTRVRPGEEVRLSYQVKNAQRCLLQYDSTEIVITNNLSGSFVDVAPYKETAYRLWCANDPGTGKDGLSAEKTLRVYVSETEIESPSITLTSPNTGAYWYRGMENKVTWKTTGVGSLADILIRLRSMENVEYVLEWAQNDGVERVVVPTSVPVDEYYVEVKTSVDGNSYKDASDTYIKVLPQLIISQFSLQNFDGVENHYGKFVWESEGTQSCGIYRKMPNGGKETIPGIAYPLPVSGSHELVPITPTAGQTNNGAEFTLLCTGAATTDGKDAPSVEKTIQVWFKG